MKVEEYLGDWMKVIDKEELYIVLNKIKHINYSCLCPSIEDVFKAFKLCSYYDCKIVLIGQNPYPQKGVANGILFGNNTNITEDNISPSLQVIKESVIDFDIPHNFITFDNSLESWAKQGILMLNSALTCNVNQIGAHVMLWRPFITKLLHNLSSHTTGIIYVLFGEQAQTLKPYINYRFNTVLESKHPAYYARVKKPMPRTIFNEIDELIKLKYNEKIIWFYEQI